MDTPELSRGEDDVETGNTPAWTPANGITPNAESVASPRDAAATGEQMSSPAKRRREEKERTRVSRACDRCKK
ncbi:hypothetical protein CC86DRAFT_101136 [Ophiobolus disseminans]|uniref:Uncharacterized protein n=1 Tax=Ophiobolus disseminans TaxID=1469910 RepID=A0A6A6ZLK2_9PLEO|nr:hypothetical protein CC86DRAFT_101136 [Ophiobolus disseminans]